MSSCEVLVVGAGPIGLETAAVLLGEGHDVLVVDAGAIGATIGRFPPHTRFFTSPERLAVAGMDVVPLHQEKLTGEEYVAYLRQVARTRGLTVRTFTRVESITGEAGAFRVGVRRRSGADETITARHVVLATGGTDRPRRLGVPGEGLPHVRSHLGDPGDFFGRTVVVVGGRNSAAEAALRIYRAGGTVHLSYRRPELWQRIKYWIRPEVAALLAEGRIIGHLPSTVTGITADEVILANPDGGPEHSVAADDVLLQIGYEQDPAIWDLAGVRTSGEARAPVHDPRTMETNRPGIYVVGTASAGTQDRFGVFIETSHQHASRVAAHLSGRPAPPEVPPRLRAET